MKKMKRQTKRLVILSACALVCALGWGIFYITEPEPPVAVDESEGPAITAYEAEKVTECVIVNEAGTYTAHWTDGTPAVDGMEGIPVESDAISTLRRSCINMKGVEEVADGAGHLADFGLEDPAMTATIVENGNTHELAFGNEVPGVDTASRYCLADGKVYVVYETMAKPFGWSEEDFVSKQITPEYDSSEQVLIADRITVTGSCNDGGDIYDGKPVSIAYASSSQVAGYTLNAYRLTSPIEYDVNAAVIDAYISSFFDLKAEETVCVNPGEEELAACGLTEPWAVAEVEYRLAEEPGTMVLKVSAPAADGTAYVMSDAVSVIYRCNVSGITGLTTTANDLLSRNILIPAVTEVSQVEIRSGDSEHTISIRNFGNDGEMILADGKEVDGQYFRNFYYTLISQQADKVYLENVKDAAPSDGKETARVIYTYSDKSRGSDTLIFRTMTEQRLFVVLNDGERGFEITNAQLEQMLTALEHLAAGEAVEARY